MQDNDTLNAIELKIGIPVIALGMFAAPWLLGFTDHGLAAWIAWTLGAFFLATALGTRARQPGYTASALLVLGLWTLLAPGILGFDLSDAAAFWTHTIAGLLALRASYVAFQDIDPRGVQTRRR